ncbi:MAG: recombination protein RecR [Chitinophagaceae bacterium]|nr:recombination protein RecR [Chitinophagaceae bacterium]MBL0055532.1 recombination protein RecR [Chitinophagaceae bacterium]
MIFSSTLLENAVNEFAKLPGIGKKTALRLVLHLVKQDLQDVTQFSDIIARMRNEIKFCKRCFNIADDELCNICKNGSRKTELICVVENIRDVIAIESTQQFNGVYHVLGGVISPLDGIGPDQLTIDPLLERLQQESVEEVIFALSPTIQGDTTIYYISKKLNAGGKGPAGVKISTIARGIAFGGELEYADEMTLAKSISNRIPVENFIVSGN